MKKHHVKLIDIPDGAVTDYVFCPRVDSNFYPNQSLHFSVSYANKVADELRKLEYKGGIAFADTANRFSIHNLTGYWAALREFILKLWLMSDRLTPKRVLELFEAGLSFYALYVWWSASNWNTEVMMREAGVPNERYILRDRWHNEEDQFGLKLTNRSGSLDFGPDPKEFEQHPCFYPSYPRLLIGMVMSYNVSKIGIKNKIWNIGSSDLLDIWKSVKYQKHVLIWCMETGQKVHVLHVMPTDAFMDSIMWMNGLTERWIIPIWNSTKFILLRSVCSFRIHAKIADETWQSSKVGQVAPCCLDLQLTSMQKSRL